MTQQVTFGCTLFYTQHSILSTKFQAELNFHIAKRKKEQLNWIKEGWQVTTIKTTPISRFWEYTEEQLT